MHGPTRVFWASLTPFSLQGGGSTTSVLAPSIAVTSNTVEGGTRTVVATRPLKSSYHTFVAAAADATTPFIAAVGTSANL